MRDGSCAINNHGATPNYFPSKYLRTSRPPQVPQPDHELWNGTVVSFESEVSDADFAQARQFWTVTLAKDPKEQENIVQNFAGALRNVSDEEILQRAFGKFPGAEIIVRLFSNGRSAMFARIDKKLGARVQIATRFWRQQLVKQLSALQSDDIEDEEANGKPAANGDAKLALRSNGLNGSKKLANGSTNMGMFAHKTWSLAQ